MKLTTKIYHILSHRLKGKEAAKNRLFKEGYKAALLDSLKLETQIKKGAVDWQPPHIIENPNNDDRTIKTFIRSI